VSGPDNTELIAEARKFISGDPTWMKNSLIKRLTDALEDVEPEQVADPSDAKRLLLNAELASTIAHWEDDEDGTRGTSVRVRTNEEAAHVAVEALRGAGLLAEYPDHPLDPDDSDYIVGRDR